MVYVTAVHMEGGNGHEHIAQVRWRNPETQATGASSRSEMVEFIRDKKGAVRVQDGTGWVAVGVVNAQPSYIRTHADGRWTDNLLALPRY